MLEIHVHKLRLVAGGDDQPCRVYTSWKDPSGNTHTVTQTATGDASYTSGGAYRTLSDSQANNLISQAQSKGRDITVVTPNPLPCR